MTTQEFFNSSIYFTSYEFDSPDLIGSGDLMNVDFLIKLSQARSISKVPFVINSGYRTKEHNKKVGGVGDSAHTKGLAADIRVTSNYHRHEILTALILVGFTRLGIGNGFIHVDNDSTKPSNRMWLY